MIAALLVFGLAAGVAQAKVIECPATHQGARLIGAGMYEGEQKEIELMGGRQKVRGGWDVDYGFNGGEVKWVACWYEPATPLWRQVSPAAHRCDLKERTAASGQVAARVSCR